MKKFALLTFVLVMILTIVPVSAAAGGDVLNGTPVIDGKLDDMYKESISVELEKFAFYTNGKTSAVTSAEGTKTYILWDENYLYLCTVVNDTTSTTRVDKNIDYTNWATADNIEHYIRTSNGSTGGQVHIGAIGEGLKAEATVCDAAGVIIAATATDNGYVTELAIPITVVELKAGNQFGYSLQYNDFIPDDNATIASGFQTAGDIAVMTLSDKKVTAPPAPEKPAEPTEAPKTADAAGAALVMAAMFGAVMVIKNKKK